jgi:hypothetical protein
VSGREARNTDMADVTDVPNLPRMLYIFVLEIGTRRILHWNVTNQPIAE